MILRKFGKLILGKATPFQLVSACTLGALLGFTPMGMQAPALWLMLLLLLLILNANLWLAAIVTVGTKLASLALGPVAFACGVALLDGPLEGLFRKLVNAPVLAFCGLEYYSVSGGLALGGVLGLGLGLLLASMVGKLRRAFVSLDESSEAFRKWASKGWVKFLTWLLLGAKPNRATYEKLGTVRIGNPVRILGVVFAGAVIVLCWAGVQFASTPILTAFLVAGLERANGATVDLESAELTDGKLTLRGLALADSTRLDHDVFRAGELELDVHLGDLLRKRLHIERVRISSATSGELRARPGRRLVGGAPELLEPQASDGDTARSGQDWSLDDVIVNASKVRERLAQIRRWLERLQGAGGATEDDAGADEQRAERRARQIAAEGRRWVRAEHLVDRTPTVRVDSLEIEKLEALEWNRRELAVTATHLSTHPRLVREAPSIEVKSLDGKFAVKIQLGRSQTSSTPNLFSGHLHDLDGTAIGEQLRAGDGEAVRGGTIDVKLAGSWGGADGALDGRLETTLENVRMKIGGHAETIQRLDLVIGLGGTLANPRIQFQKQQLTDALVAAGKRELANRVAGELDRQVDDARKKLEKEASKALDKLFKRD